MRFVRSRSSYSSLISLVLGAGSMLWGASSSAQSLGMYLSPPGEQNTTRSGALVETFTGAPGSLGASGTFAVGSYTATGGSRSNASQYGGAGGTGQFIGGFGSGEVSVTVVGDRKYVGFWWSAGDGSNQIDFYDDSDNLLATVTTASLTALLSGGGTVTAINGSQYAKAAYFGNPNSAFAGQNSG